MPTDSYLSARKRRILKKPVCLWLYPDDKPYFINLQWLSGLQCRMYQCHSEIMLVVSRWLMTYEWHSITYGSVKLGKVLSVVQSIRGECFWICFSPQMNFFNYYFLHEKLRDETYHHAYFISLISINFCRSIKDKVHKLIISTQCPNNNPVCIQLNCSRRMWTRLGARKNRINTNNDSQ